MKNPPWEKDEIILALDLYLKSYPHIPNKTHKDVIKLSELLNSLPIHSKTTYGNNFRNPSGVSMKLGNFLTLDPRYKGKGLKSISKNDKKIWNEFYHDQKRLQILVNTIKSYNFSDIQKDYEEVINLDEEFSEGKILYKVHKIRERNKSLINKKKKKVLKETSRLECEVCGFDFFKTYGEIGKEYIECHHNKPISTLQPDEKTKLSDLSLVCSNCHRMIHRTKPWLSINKLKEKINI